MAVILERTAKEILTVEFDVIRQFLYHISVNSRKIILENYI